MNPVVATYADLLIAPVGSMCLAYFPFIYIMAPWGPAQMVYNDVFTPPS